MQKLVIIIFFSLFNWTLALAENICTNSGWSCSGLISGNLENRATYTVTASDLCLYKTEDDNGSPYYVLSGELSSLWQEREVKSHFIMTAYSLDEGMEHQNYIEDQYGITITDYPKLAYFDKKSKILTIKQEVSVRRDVHFSVKCYPTNN